MKRCPYDENCHDVQVDYLKETHNPKDWKFGEWLQRMERINNYLEYMDNDIPKLMEHKIIQDANQLNLPPYLQTKFIEARGHQKQALLEVMTIVKDLEKAHAMHSEEHRNKEESKQRDGTKMVMEKIKTRRAKEIQTIAKVTMTKANVDSLVIIKNG